MKWKIEDIWNEKYQEEQIEKWNRNFNIINIYLYIYIDILSENIIIHMCI